MRPFPVNLIFLSGHDGGWGRKRKKERPCFNMDLVHVRRSSTATRRNSKTTIIKANSKAGSLRKENGSWLMKDVRFVLKTFIFLIHFYLFLCFLPFFPMRLCATSISSTHLDRFDSLTTFIRLIYVHT